VQNHGRDFVLDRLSDRFRDRETLARLRQEGIEAARAQLEAQFAICDDPYEHAALERIVDYFLARRVEVTVVLFPLMPAIVSEKAKETTLARYAERVANLAKRRPIRVVDMTLDTPLEDADFQRDRDHVSADGNRKLAAWALDHDLSWLLETAGDRSSRREQ